MWLAEFHPLWRWGLVCSVGGGLILNAERMRNQAYFPFKFAFLSLFNALVVSVFVVGLLMLIFGDLLMDKTPDGISAMKWRLSHVFIEGMNYVFVGNIVNFILSLLLKKHRS